MCERELLGVQELAVEVADARAKTCVLDCVVAAGAVSFIADDRMFQPREMHSDLMSSSGFELNVQEREAIEPAPHTIERQSIPTTAHHGHTRPVRRIAR